MISRKRWRRGQIIFGVVFAAVLAFGMVMFERAGNYFVSSAFGILMIFPLAILGGELGELIAERVEKREEQKDLES